jgi:hypothetical protein
MVKHVPMSTSYFFIMHAKIGVDTAEDERFEVRIS